MTKVGINGFGRIGREVFRVAFNNPEVEVVAVNDPGDITALAHLLKYDSIHGTFNHEVSIEGNYIIVDDRKIEVFACLDPAQIPWGEAGAEIVVESTGRFTEAAKAGAHLHDTVKKVIISAPAKGEDITIVMGVNEDKYDPAKHNIISNASCTTNCMCPFVKPLMDKLGIVDGMMTTIHAFTNDQVLTDVKHKDLRRARAAADNIIPTKTGAAKAVGVVIPELKGKLDGYAMRVPTLNVSVADLTFNAKRPTTVEEVNKIILEASESPELKGILGYNELPLVSSDFNHTSFSSIFDATLTKVIDGTLVKAVAWYDNEWGFSCRMLDTAVAMYNAK